MRLFGYLIRDAEPRESDLRCAVANRACDRPQAIVVQLLATYLPKNQIPRLGHDLDQALWSASP